MKHLTLLLLLTLALVGCRQEYYFPIASGRPYEVLVVMNPDEWMAPEGRALYRVLDSDVPGLPQPEPSFHISQCSEKSFDKTLQLFRNIIFVEIDPLLTRTRMRYARNKWAMDQYVITLQAPTEQAFIEYCITNRQKIIDFLTRTEMNRLVAELKEKHSRLVSDLAQEMFSCGLYAPDEIKSSKRGRDFFWTSNNAPSGIISLCMYTYPYEGPSTFTKQYVLSKRDSVMRANIPGARPGMYMTTDTANVTVRPIWVHGAYAMEARGLWYVEGDGMGGPFVSHSRVDTLARRVVVAEGFVYAPEKMKRGLMRRLEGALYSLTLPGEALSDSIK